MDTTPAGLSVLKTKNPLWFRATSLMMHKDFRGKDSRSQRQDNLSAV